MTFLEEHEGRRSGTFKKIDFQIPKTPLEEIPLNIYETGFVRARETYDDFIFETIEPYCNKVSQRKISKEILKRALTEYFKNHPKEQEWKEGEVE